MKFKKCLLLKLSKKQINLPNIKHQEMNDLINLQIQRDRTWIHLNLNSQLLIVKRIQKDQNQPQNSNLETKQFQIISTRLLWQNRRRKLCRP